MKVWNAAKPTTIQTCPCLVLKNRYKSTRILNTPGSLSQSIAVITNGS